ncbi:MAG: hypothetical protein IJX63_01150 [Lachnospiraceae bacterium]|nr:hypothetical protein [Lachnospiraceae bacterium]
MLLELSGHDLGEIQALKEMFDDACFHITDNHISVEVSLKDADSQKLDEKYGVYGCILQMYYDKIDIGAITVEQRFHIIDTLNTTKEFFEAMCGTGVSYNSETVDKLLMYFAGEKV